MTRKQNVIWIADDEPNIRWVLEKAFSQSGFQTRSFEDGYRLINALASEAPSVILTDIHMPGMTGIELITRVKEKHPELPIIVMTAYSDLQSTVDSFSEGAFEFIAKPFDTDEVVQTIERAIEQQEPIEEAQTSIEENLSAIPSHGIIGQSPAMQEAFRAIARLSKSNATVLITGESGTGKELIAAALHQHSSRSAAPFIALNMAALPNDLIEAELFGHEKGAFTGATSQRAGRFEQAHGGTLFLDEIGDMPIEAQTRLLRVLSENSFYRIGGRRSIEVDVRIIAATHQNLEVLVHEQAFREDLYHRLNVIRVHVPALRDRTSDIELLANQFLLKAATEHDTEPKRLTPAVLKLLGSMNWPGNVRQLENLCQWLTVMVPGQEVFEYDLPPELRANTSDTPKGAEDIDSLVAQWTENQLKAGKQDLFPVLRERVERAMLQPALNYTRGNMTKTASILGLGRTTVRRRIEQYGMTATNPNLDE